MLTGLLYACNSKRPDAQAYPNDDTPTSGTIRVAIDYNDTFAFNQQIETFMGIYQEAKLIPIYKSEQEILKYLADDSVRFAIMHRELKPDEQQYFKGKKRLEVKTTKLGYTAMALIVGRNSALSTLNRKQLINLLNGKGSDGSNTPDFQLVFDNAGSSNLRYLQDSVLHGKVNANTLTALKTPHQVIDFIAENPTSIGFVGVDWLIDHDALLSQALYEKVNFLAIENPINGEFYKPYPKQIAMREYPFILPIYAHNIHSTTGLASGFVTHMLSQSGVVLFKKSRIVPVYYDVRKVEVDRKMWNNF